MKHLMIPLIYLTLLAGCTYPNDFDPVSHEKKATGYSFAICVTTTDPQPYLNYEMTTDGYIDLTVYFKPVKNKLCLFRSGVKKNKIVKFSFHLRSSGSVENPMIVKTVELIYIQGGTTEYGYSAVRSAVPIPHATGDFEFSLFTGDPSEFIQIGPMVDGISLLQPVTAPPNL